MPRFISFLTGLLLGVTALLTAIVVLLLFLPRFLVVDQEPVKADAAAGENIVEDELGTAATAG